MDGIFFEFPLSALIFIRDDRSRLDHIISWCIITLANSLSEGSHKERVVSACSHLGISGSNYATRMNRYSDLNDFLMRQENIYGKQPYCRIGKKLIFETRDGLFDFNQFKMLCAIGSIIGKRKKFVRITYERLGYRMQGFKNKEMFNDLKDKIELLSYKRLRRLIEILHAKKFFSKFTYANRQMFFSTRLSDDELRESVKRSKIYWAKRKQSLEDRNYSLEIKGELEKMLLEERTLKESERLNSERVKIYRMKRVS